MPTKHRRIAIVRDGEVEDALKMARSAGNGSPSDAAVARDLILRGASAVETSAVESDEDGWARSLVDKYGARPAKRPLAEVLKEIEPLPMDPDDPYRATRILEELREERLP